MAVSVCIVEEPQGATTALPAEPASCVCRSVAVETQAPTVGTHEPPPPVGGAGVAGVGVGGVVGLGAGGGVGVGVGGVVGIGVGGVGAVSFASVGGVGGKD